MRAGSAACWRRPLAIYFLYHYVLELAMRGSTPGKRMAGVRLRGTRRRRAERPERC